jgi:ATP-dependent protease HslVU (ClpYQ) peptidase subunit
MTCIVGIANGSDVYIGGDSGVSDEENILPAKNSKVFFNGQYKIGYAGSVGIGQLAKYITTPPPGDDIEKTLRTIFVKRLKELIDEYGGFNYLEENQTDWLIGIHGRLFEISSEDWQVCEYDESSIGSGSSIALGSLYTSREIYTDIKMRLEIALLAACELSTTCLLPVKII